MAMMLKRGRKLAMTIMCFCACFITNSAALSDGYVLCGAYSGTSTVLYDKNGNVVFTWNHGSLPDSLNGYSCYLMENGDLLRTAQVPEQLTNSNMAPKQGAINQVDPSGKVVWRYTLANDTFMLHHDMKIMPNGNILACVFVVKTKAQLIAAGVDTTVLGRGRMGAKSLLAEKIIEIKPKSPEGGDIVWEWDIFDHVVPKIQASEHPELFSGGISTALFSGQWVHLNGIDYNAKTNLIVFSSRIFSECYVIDHSTTTVQAKTHAGGTHGKGGDLLYRWGNTANYGMTGNYKLSVLHCTNWIPEGYPGAGNILFYHNNSDDMQSEAVEIAPPMEGNKFKCTSGQPFGPAEPTWKFSTTEDLYSPYMSSALRMPNGNTLIHEAFPQAMSFFLSKKSAIGDDTSSYSRLWEVTKDNAVVWKWRMKLSSQSGSMMMMAWNPAKIMYYPSTYKGITNLFTRAGIGVISDFRNQATASSAGIVALAGRLAFSNVSGCEITLMSLQGKKVASLSPKAGCFVLDTRAFPKGAYCVKVISGGKVRASRMVMVSL